MVLVLWMVACHATEPKGADTAGDPGAESDATGAWSGSCVDESGGTGTIDAVDLELVDDDGALSGTFTIPTGYATGPTAIPYAVDGARTGADVTFDLRFGAPPDDYVAASFAGVLDGDALDGDLTGSDPDLHCSFTR
jgi:hypothetical protein